MSSVLLLSGGLDSTAVAAMLSPDQCLCIDYGQPAAEAEKRAAAQICLELGLRFQHLSLRVRETSEAVMPSSGDDTFEPPPANWPFRNQLLITAAAAWAAPRGYQTILVGTVASDSTQHADGTREFVSRVSDLLAMQEGGLRAEAPGIDLSTEQLISQSSVSDQVLAWTHSCHWANTACAQCPGCAKHSEVLRRLGRLQ